jgi:hypothetical protein
MPEIVLSSGEVVWLPVRSGEWYGVALKRNIRGMRGLTTQRNAKALSGVSVDKVMQVYRDLEWGGSDLMPSGKRLAGMSGLSANTARRAQQWLIENGWLEQVGRFKVGRHGWKVRLAIPQEDHDGSAHDWTGLHPERKVPWDSEGPPWARSKVAPSNTV